MERIEAGAWKGKTAVAFTEYVGKDVTPLIRKSHDSFDKASRALHRWANELLDFQDEANRLEKSAGEKLEARETAQQKADAKGDGKGSEELGKASGAVDEITGKVHDWKDLRHKRAAGNISKELDKAGDIAPDEPGFWDKLTKGVSDAWDATGQWIKDHADMIKLIGDLLSDLSAVLGMLAIITLPFPPLAAIFGTAALIASGLALAAHGLAKWGGADVSWMQMGLDAVGLMPGIGMFSKGIKVVGAGKAAAMAENLGQGFAKTSIGSSRILMAFGKNSSEITGGTWQGGPGENRRQGRRRLRGRPRGQRPEVTYGWPCRRRLSRGPVDRLQGPQPGPGREHQPLGKAGIAIHAGARTSPRSRASTSMWGTPSSPATSSRSRPPEAEAPAGSDRVDSRKRPF